MLGPLTNVTSLGLHSFSSKKIFFQFKKLETARAIRLRIYLQSSAFVAGVKKGCFTFVERNIRLF